MVRKKLKHQLAGNVSDALELTEPSQVEVLADGGAATVALPGSSGSWRWMLLVLGACSLSGGLTVSALMSLMSLPPATDCQKLTAVSPDMERLYCAQAAARTGGLPQLLAGLALVGQWTEAHPLYNEAQRSLEDWSKQVLAIAQRQSEKNLESAIELANKIPTVSPLHQEAQQTIARWRQYWNRGEGLEAAALKAMKTQDWNGAFQQIEEIRKMQQDEWRITRANALLQRLNAERQARQMVGKAFALAKGGQPDQIDAALVLLGSMNKGTYVWAELQPKLKQWGETLLKFGFQEWRVGNLDRAIALGQRASLTSALAPEGQNLIRLSRARKLVVATLTNWEASPQHLLNLMEAIAAAKQIPPQSRFYAQAQDSVRSWQMQLEDVRQLQYAQVAASLKQPATLQLAAQQARQVAPGRFRRVQAQTLSAHWGREVQRVEDQPVLVRARGIAEAGTVPALQQAIALADQVTPGRALHGEAKSLMFVWTQQIQRIEDQPILNQAIALASDGDLSGAIQSAIAIRPGRALYPRAQSLIGDWRAEIRRIELARIRAQQAALEAQRQAAARREAEARAREQVIPDPVVTPSDIAPVAPPPVAPPTSDLPQYIPLVPPTEPSPQEVPPPVQDAPPRVAPEVPPELAPPPTAEPELVAPLREG